MKKIYTRCSVIFILAIAIASAVKAQHVAMLTPLLGGYTHSYPGNFNSDTASSTFAVLNGVCYFTANTDNNQLQALWRSDGTAAGTYMVTDRIKNIRNIMVVENNLYILDAGDLWISDGTDAGTVPHIFSQLSGCSNFVLFKDNIYFVQGLYLYRYDTAAKTFTQVYSFQALLLDPHYSQLVVLNETTLAINITVNGVSNTFISDGTSAGTRRLDLNKNNKSFTALQSDGYFINNNNLYINPATPEQGLSHLVTNLNGATLPSGYINKPLQVLNNILYFPATTAATGTELYKYDPATTDGITLVKDIIPGAGSANISFNEMAVVNGWLYFTVKLADGSRQLWKSDGTADGTTIVKEFTTGANNYFSSFTAASTTLYFNFTDSLTGNELWKSDGTDSGTMLVKDINPGIYNANPAHITPLSNGVFFSANDGVHGIELWRADGTDTGTTLVKDINTITPLEPVNMRSFTQLNKVMLFSATDNNYGTELWATDGTPAGTALIKDVVPGTASGNPFGFIVKDNYACFFADSTTRGRHRQVWRTDGTAAGTFLLKRFDDTAAQAGSAFFAAGNYVYFFVKGSTINALWRTDGTGAGTVSVMNFDSTAGQSYIIGSIPQGNYAYFGMKTGNSTYTLWSTNGTVAGTVALGNISGSPYTTATIGNVLYFANGEILYSTDGTISGTVLAHTFSQSIANTVAFNNKLLVFSGSQLWLMNNGVFTQADSSVNDYLFNITILKNRAFFYRDVYRFDQDNNYIGEDYYLTAIDTNAHVETIYHFGQPPRNLIESGGKIWMTTDGKLAILNDVAKTLQYNPKNYDVYDLINPYGKPYFEVFNNVTLTGGIGYSDGTYQGTQVVQDALLPLYRMGDLMQLNNRLLFIAKPTSYINAAFPNLPPLLYAYTLPAELPVTLTNFTAKLQKGNGLLNWSTATEQNSDYFSVLRSADGLHFSNIGKVAAAGNSTYRQQYDYTDYDVANLGFDKLYYRLQQFDKDGKFSYSKIVMLTINTGFTASVSPIPVANQLTVNIASAKKQTVLITITDMASKTITSAAKPVEAGSTTLTYSAASWTRGVYQVQITQANGNKQTISVIR